MPQILGAEVIAIDDKPEALENFRKMLLSEGYSLSVFDSSRDAAASDEFVEQSKKLILISLDLKLEDPRQVHRLLLERFPDARFAFISQAFQPERIEELLSFGIQAFFTKPLSYKEFLKWADEDTDRSHSIDSAEELAHLDR